MHENKDEQMHLQVTFVMAGQTPSPWHDFSPHHGLLSLCTQHTHTHTHDATHCHTQIHHTGCCLTPSQPEWLHTFTLITQQVSHNRCHTTGVTLCHLKLPAACLSACPACTCLPFMHMAALHVYASPACTRLPCMHMSVLHAHGCPACICQPCMHMAALHAHGCPPPHAGRQARCTHPLECLRPGVS